MDRPTHNSQWDREQAAQMADEQRQRLQMHDAHDLADAARMRYPDDDLSALAWVAFVWRSRPDAWETEVRRFAIELMRDDLTERDRGTWDRVVANRETGHLTAMATILDAVQAKHDRHTDPTHIGAADESIIDRLRAAA
jgi:hypothetical protein